MHISREVFTLKEPWMAPTVLPPPKEESVQTEYLTTPEVHADVTG